MKKHEGNHNSDRCDECAYYLGQKWFSGLKGKEREFVIHEFRIRVAGGNKTSHQLGIYD